MHKTRERLRNLQSHEKRFYVLRTTTFSQGCDCEMVNAMMPTTADTGSRKKNTKCNKNSGRK